MEGLMKYLSNTVTLEYSPERCVGCGICVEICPHGVFAIEHKKAVILERDRCMECGACAANCAFGALGVAKGVGCAAALINSLITGGEPSCDCSRENKSGSCC